MNRKYILDIGHDSFQNEKNGCYQTLLNIKVKSCEADFEATRAFIVNFSTIKKNKSIVELIMFLSVINDYLENKFLDLYVMNIFEKTIEYIKRNRLKREQGKLSVKYKFLKLYSKVTLLLKDVVF